MGLIPTLPTKYFTDAERLPIGTILMLNSEEEGWISKRLDKDEVYIIIGYDTFGSYGSGINWGYREQYKAFAQKQMRELYLAINKNTDYIIL